MDIKSVCGNCGVVSVAEKGMEPLPGKTPGQWHQPDGAGYIAKRRKAKKRRVRTLLGANTPLTIVKDAQEEVSGDGPSLAEITDLAEETFSLKAVASGYSVESDMYVIQLAREDGRVSEAIFDAKAELQQWTLMDEDFVVEKKSAPGTLTSVEIADIALKSEEIFEGSTVLQVLAEDFEGQEAWVVEATGKDGAEYDIYVSADGTVLGHDDYSIDLKSEEAPETVELEEVVEPEEKVEPIEAVEPGVEPEVEEPVVEPEEELVSAEDFAKELAEIKSLGI